jgi:hypothetical protein
MLLRDDFKDNFEKIISLIADSKNREHSPVLTPTKSEEKFFSPKSSNKNDDGMFEGVLMEDGTFIAGTCITIFTSYTISN